MSEPTCLLCDPITISMIDVGGCMDNGGECHNEWFVLLMGTFGCHKNWCGDLTTRETGTTR
jgi:hypothetical protein